jgi:hypothetical protein
VPGSGTGWPRGIGSVCQWWRICWLPGLPDLGAGGQTGLVRQEGQGGRWPAGWLLRPRSLRAGLMAAALCLLAAGAAAMTGACGLVARDYLMAQADSQLRAYADHLTGHAFVATPWSGPAPGAGGLGGTVSFEVRGAAGQLVMREDRGNRAGQVIPAVSAGAAAQAGQLATIAAGGGGGSWRVIAEPVHYRARRLPFTYSAQGVAVLVTSRARPGLDGTLVAGLDLAGIGQATARLAVTGLAVSGMVILVIACLGARGDSRHPPAGRPG